MNAWTCPRSNDYEEMLKLINGKEDESLRLEDPKAEPGSFQIDLSY